MTDVQLFQLPQADAYRFLPDNTRIWIYQSSREFTPHEVSSLKNDLARFTESWVSHNRLLRAYGDVLLNRFLLLMVDESQADASGCSIDKSVYFLQHLCQTYGIDLFDRMTFAWLDGDTVGTANRDEFAGLYQKGEITGGTLVFDNLVQTKADFETGWLKPLAKSWHKRMI